MLYKKRFFAVLGIKRAISLPDFNLKMNTVGEVIVFICLILGSRGQWLDENCGSGGSTSSPWLASIYIWDQQKWEIYYHSSGTLISDREYTYINLVNSV